MTAATGTPASLDKHFDHQRREPELYALWEQRGIYRPEAAADQHAPVFNIAMPPPNANGELHLGHAYGYTVMDVLGRFHRLCGERVLLLPGKDHAGIQTQVVFEKKLRAEGVDPKSLSTAELYERCYAFCIDRAQYMRGQEKTLGISADWSRELFTLDPRLNEIIFETFERMWADGLVYRGTRIVNWSVFSQTAISDVEVEYREQDGNLWYIRYPWAAVHPQTDAHSLTLPNGAAVRVGEGGIVTATTRPETMLGDTALAVHPDDERYRNFIGQEVIVPLVNRRIRIIGDKRVDPAYGTGVIKVTPAHDFADYDIGRDHHLQIVQVIGKDGRMTAEAGESFRGLPSAQCREAVTAQLAAGGMLLDTTTIRHKVPIGERGKDVIEPLISEQWFVNVDKPGNSLRQRALEFIRAGRVKIYPARFQVLFEQWLENLRDWNISRQIWWGHRMPVWYREQDGAQEIRVGRTAPEGAGWVQERDTFDTWFSSGQWAFSTFAAHGQVNLDAPRPGNQFFPSHTMVMGRDILMFWACRMLLLTAYRMEDVPWHNIFFTGLIRDEHGQKMSKSKGNGIEPNEMIAKFGADALRLALIMGATPGNDINFSERKIEGYSKFINKIWNAAKLVELKVGGLPAPAHDWRPTGRLESTRWILNELDRVTARTRQLLEQYDISIAADELYSFTWTVFCDWYLEMMKVMLEHGRPEEQAEVAWTTRTCLRSILTMLHPFMPFVTEEIYQTLGFLRAGDLLAMEPWPGVAAAGLGLDGTQIGECMEIISAVRSVKAALTIPHKRIRAAVSKSYSPELTLLMSELARIDAVRAEEIPTHLALRKPYTGGVIVLEVEGKENYRLRLEKDAESNRTIIAGLERKLAGAFATQARPDVVEKERERLAAAQQALGELERELSLLQSS